jgi:hypothetical protein
MDQDQYGPAHAVPHLMLFAHPIAGKTAERPEAQHLRFTHRHDTRPSLRLQLKCEI